MATLRGNVLTGRFRMAGIGQYVIVNLPEGKLEVYTEALPEDGRYARRTDYLPGQRVLLTLDAGGTIEFAVAEFLPRREDVIRS
jgi:hypothetical protein